MSALPKKNKPKVAKEVPSDESSPSEECAALRFQQGQGHDYSKKSCEELKQICRERNITGYSGKKKQELIEMILEPEKPSVMDKPSVIKTLKKEKSISKEDAEKSADEWLGTSESIMRTWLVHAIMDEKQHRDIGKVLAYVAEIHVNKWLSEKTGRPVKNIVGESYDGRTDDDKPPIRNQIKFRMDAWHFETTRRNSKKNADTNSTGHVAYKNNEFDILAIFKPSPTFGITGSIIRCIPVAALINPKKPDQLITNINAPIRKIYDCDKKTEEVILLYQTPASLQD